MKVKYFFEILLLFGGVFAVGMALHSELLKTHFDVPRSLILAGVVAFWRFMVVRKRYFT
jgi:hypothetical protein